MSLKYKNIYSIFHDIAEANADAIAIEDKGKTITYRDLDFRASLVASYLVEKGIRLEDVVGVMLPRSIDFIACILGILKVGAVYLPIDEDFPAARRDFMLTNSKAKLLIDTFPETKKIVEINREISLQNLAYIIYTSGSTGKPKPVAVSHSAVISLMQGQKYDAKRVVANANFCFDVSIVEIFLPLLNGCTVILLDKEDILTRETFEKNTKNSDTVFLSLSIFKHLVQEGCHFDHINYLFIGGENFQSSILKSLNNPPKHLINSYGPTENTVVSLDYEIHFSGTAFCRNESVPIAPLNQVPLNQLGFAPLGDHSNDIGRSLESKRVSLRSEYLDSASHWLAQRGKIFLTILNNNLESVSSGELFLGGQQLARGYLYDPALTAEKFIANPFGDGDRLYKTGDLVHLDKEGIIFDGRVDNQVKIRGNRIELSEIERTIESYSGVKECVVLVKKTNNVDVLTAYIISTLSEPELGDKLKKDLPNYMIPNEFIFIDSIPLTSNGKVDTKELLKIEKSPTPFVAPSTETELLVCDIFKSILNKQKFSVNDDFFHVGGDSILAMQLVVRAKKKGLNISLKEVLERKTIKNIAATISSEKYNIIPEKKLRKTPFSLTPWQDYLCKNKVGKIYRIIQCNSPEDVVNIRNNLNKLNILHKEVSLARVNSKQFYDFHMIQLTEFTDTEAHCDFKKFISDASVQVSLITHLEKKYLLVAVDCVLFDKLSLELIINMLIKSESTRGGHSFAQFIDVFFKTTGEDFSLEQDVVEDRTFKKIERKIKIEFLEVVRSSNDFSAADFFLSTLLISYPENENWFSFLGDLRHNFPHFDFKNTLGNFEYIFRGKFSDIKRNISIITQFIEILRLIRITRRHVSQNIDTRNLVFFAYLGQNYHLHDLTLGDVNFIVSDEGNELDITVIYNQKTYSFENVSDIIYKFIATVTELIEILKRGEVYIFNNLNVADVLHLVEASSSDRKLFFLPPISGHAFPFLVFSNNELFSKKGLDVYAVGDLEYGYDRSECSDMVALSLKFANLIREYARQTDIISLVGWCFGGYIALEATRDLLAAGYSVGTTILIDSPIPELQKDISNCSDQEIRDANKFFDENAILPGTFSEQQIILNLKKNNYISAHYSPDFFEGAIDLITTDMSDKNTIDYWMKITKKLNIHRTDFIHSEIFDDKNVPRISQLISELIN